MLDYLITKKSKLDNYPEYKALLQEYKEGILLFDLMNKVWTKAVEDTIALQAFFTANRSSYIWPEVDATIYICANLETAKKVKRNIYKKNRNITDEEILALVNTNSTSNLNIDRKRAQ